MNVLLTELLCNQINILVNWTFGSGNWVAVNPLYLFPLRGKTSANLRAWCPFKFNCYFCHQICKRDQIYRLYSACTEKDNLCIFTIIFTSHVLCNPHQLMTPTFTVLVKHSNAGRADFGLLQPAGRISHDTHLVDIERQLTRRHTQGFPQLFTEDDKCIMYNRW